MRARVGGRKKRKEGEKREGVKRENQDTWTCVDSKADSIACTVSCVACRTYCAMKTRPWTVSDICFCVCCAYMYVYIDAKEREEGREKEREEGRKTES